MLQQSGATVTGLCKQNNCRHRDRGSQECVLQRAGAEVKNGCKSHQSHLFIVTGSGSKGYKDGKYFHGTQRAHAPGRRKKYDQQGFLLTNRSDRQGLCTQISDVPLETCCASKSCLTERSFQSNGTQHDDCCAKPIDTHELRLSKRTKS